MAAAALLVLIAFTVGGYLLWRGREGSVPAFLPTTKGRRMLMSMDTFTFAQSEKGKVSWRMTAATADLYENKEVRLRDLVVVFQNPGDPRRTTMRSDRGTMDTASGNASLHRGTHPVSIETSDGYLLTTNSLFWKAGDRLVWTADPFTLIGCEIYLEGIAVTADVDMRTIKVQDRVKAVLQE